MEPLNPEELDAIARSHNIDYERIESRGSLEVSTRMSRTFPIAREVAFKQFSDPATHVRLFSIIKGSSTIPREPIGKIVAPNQFYAMEHVEEQRVTPRMMLIRYSLNPPSMILKEGVPDPFGDLDAMGDDVDILDKKKAIVKMQFDPRGDDATRVTVESTFRATTGKVFQRGLIDHIWLNFFENLMVETKELSKGAMRTRP